MSKKLFRQLTKHFFVKVGHENDTDMIKAIKNREMLGDKIEESEKEIFYIQDESGTMHKITEAEAEKISNDKQSQYE